MRVTMRVHRQGEAASAKVELEQGLLRAVMQHLPVCVVVMSKKEGK